MPYFVKDDVKTESWLVFNLSTPCSQLFRMGFANGNELSDHIIEKFNYLWLAHFKLLARGFGPQLLMDNLPHHIEG